MMQREMRRKDKAMTQDDAMSLLQIAEYGVLSTADGGVPYGVPMNFVLVGGELFFHSAAEGRKIDNIKKNPKASFCAVPAYAKYAEKLSYAYRCVIAEGSLREVTRPDEVRSALAALTRKYTSLSEAAIAKAVNADISRTRIFALSLEAVSGKASYENMLGKASAPT